MAGAGQKLTVTVVCFVGAQCGSRLAAPTTCARLRALPWVGFPQTQGRRSVKSSPADFQGFWSLFRQRATQLAGAESADDAVYDELLDKLHEIEPGLFIEFSAGRPECELIITADGDRKLFPAARAAVAQAPRLDGWTIQALKPRLGMPATAAWEGVTVKIDEVVFEPLQADDADQGLRIYVPALDQADVVAAHNALLRALDHALGEERFALGVQFTEVLPMPENFDPEAHIPLRDLERFMDWRDRRRERDA